MHSDVLRILVTRLPELTATLQQIFGQHATLEDDPLSESDRRKLITTLQDWRAAVQVDPSTEKWLQEKAAELNILSKYVREQTGLATPFGASLVELQDWLQGLPRKPDPWDSQPKQGAAAVQHQQIAVGRLVVIAAGRGRDDISTNGLKSYSGLFTFDEARRLMDALRDLQKLAGGTAWTELDRRCSETLNKLAKIVGMPSGEPAEAHGAELLLASDNPESTIRTMLGNPEMLPVVAELVLPALKAFEKANLQPKEQRSKVRKHNAKTRKPGQGIDDPDTFLKLTAQLTLYHVYESGVCDSRKPPIGVRKLATLAKVSASRATNYFDAKFNDGKPKGHSIYKRLCGDVDKISYALRMLNNELTPSILSRPLECDPQGSGDEE
jgi:hypothetical protein